MTETREYTHLPLNQEVTGIAGYYTPLKEVRLPCRGKEVLYVVGQAALESSCCGAACWVYGVVPGYIINWQKGRNEAGLPVSEVAPVSAKREREGIRQIIEEAESLSQVEFW